MGSMDPFWHGCYALQLIILSQRVQIATQAMELQDL